MASTITAEHSERHCEIATSSELQKLAGFGLTLLASVGTFGFYAIQGVLLARLLGLEMRGAFAAAILFPQAFLYLGLLGAPELFAGYAARGMADVPLRRSAAQYGLFAGLVTLAACLLFDFLFIQDELRWVLPLAAICALSLPFQQIRLALLAVDHGQRKFSRYNQIRLLAAAAFPMALILGWTAGRTDIVSICWIFVISQAAALLLVQWGMAGSWRGRGSVSLPKALGDGRHLMAAWFSTELLERLDMCLVLFLLLTSEVALGLNGTLACYASAVPIASLMIIVPNAVGLYAFNRGARTHEIPSPAAVRRFFAVGLSVQILSALALAAVLPLLVVWMYGEDFRPTIVFTWLLLPAGICRGLLQAADSYMRARGKAMVGIKARLVGVLVLITVSLVGASLLGRFEIPSVYAVPIGLGIAQAVCLVVIAINLLRDVSDFHAQSSNTSMSTK